MYDRFLVQFIIKIDHARCIKHLFYSVNVHFKYGDIAHHLFTKVTE